MNEDDKNAIEFPNFFPAAQNDFAARMEWSTSSEYNLANHAPEINLKSPIVFKAQPGEKIILDALVNDPDGDGYTIKWWQFRNKKTDTELIISNDQQLKSKIEIPNTAMTNQVLFVVLEVTDNGKNKLSSYKTIKIFL